MQGADCRGLEAEIALEILCNLTDLSASMSASHSTRCTITCRAYQALEGELANQQLSRLLVPANLTKGDGAGLVAVRLLDTTGRWCALTGCGMVSSHAMASLARARAVRASAWRGRVVTHQLWTRAACEELCPQWTCERSAWYEPWMWWCFGGICVMMRVVWGCGVGEWVCDAGGKG